MLVNPFGDKFYDRNFRRKMNFFSSTTLKKTMQILIFFSASAIVKILIIAWSFAFIKKVYVHCLKTEDTTRDILQWKI